MLEELAKIAEKIGREIHAECPDPQEDASDITGEKIAEAIRARDLQWTTEPPKEEGWYWFYNGVESKLIKIEYEDGIRVVRHGDKTYPYSGSRQNVGMEKDWHWLGPLPVPEAPKEGG